MKRRLTWLVLAMLGCAPASAAAQLQLAAGEPQSVFAASNQIVRLCWRNAGDTMHETPIQSRIMQLTSATAVCVGEAPWKKLQVLPNQTILESAVLDFPPVRAKTHFLVEWIEGSSNVIGSTEVFAYPTNLLAELGVLMNHDEGALGVYDLNNELKPLLKNLKVGFVDLENMVAENFRGKLAIIGGFNSKRSLGTSQIKTLAENGVAVVWVQPATENPKGDEPQPSFYSVPANPFATVVVQPATVARLAESPVSQFNLVFFCKLALHPEAPVLPSIKYRP